MQNKKDRLINLIQNAVGGCARNWAEVIADHLLENGVIVPLCKVGDTVYWKTLDNRIVGGKIVKSFKKFRVQVNSDLEFSFDDFELGNVIFLTREEAENLEESEVKKDG